MLAWTEDVGKPGPSVVTMKAAQWCFEASRCESTQILLCTSETSADLHAACPALSNSSKIPDLFDTMLFTPSTCCWACDQLLTRCMLTHANANAFNVAAAVKRSSWKLVQIKCFHNNLASCGLCTLGIFKCSEAMRRQIEPREPWMFLVLHFKAPEMFCQDFPSMWRWADDWTLEGVPRPNSQDYVIKCLFFCQRNTSMF